MARLIAYIRIKMPVVKNGLYHEGRDWNYYVDGKFAASTTTLVKYNGTWWNFQSCKRNSKILVMI